MKNLRLVKLLIIAGVMISSCTDLEEKPIGVFAPESFFQSASEVESAINGTYARLATSNYYGRFFSGMVMLRGDMGEYSRGDTPHDRFHEDAFDSYVNNVWPISFNIIANANNAIAGAGQVTMSDEERNALIADARFVRALVYFNTVRLWGDVPYIAEAVTDPEAMSTIVETPAAEIYQNIITDLEFAKEHLPMTRVARSRASKGSAYTLMADVYLNMGDYQNAYEHARWVIDNKDGLGYMLEADFQDLFDAEKHDQLKEPIFTVDFIGQIRGTGGEGDDANGSMTSPNCDWGGWSICMPPLKVFQAWDDRDYRKEVSFLTEAPYGGEMRPWTEFLAPQPYLAKYIRKPGKTGNARRMTDNNYAIYRYAEVLLIAAEALNQLGGPNVEAEGYINQIRARARNAAGVANAFPEDVVVSGMSKEEFHDLIIEERRMELLLEWKRWFTIKRLQMGDEVFGPDGWEPQPLWSDYHYLFPKPQSELDRNPNLKQNEGF